MPNKKIAIGTLFIAFICLQLSAFFQFITLARGSYNGVILASVSLAIISISAAAFGFRHAGLFIRIVLSLIIAVSLMMLVLSLKRII